KKQIEIMPCFRHLYVLLVVIIGWVIFRAPTIHAAYAYLQAMFGLDHNPLITSYDLQLLGQNSLFFLFGILFSMPLAKKINFSALKPKWHDLLYITTFIILLIVCMSYMVKGAYNPFIYFNF
ncbi:MAG: hypothetical protein ACRCW2_00170, partial [Cellulosilyticaceae bacterium]